tara:strand:+ start:71 stop:313 length:243 start_codon:yes stop_codon:yes gene_type:complete
MAWFYIATAWTLAVGLFFYLLGASNEWYKHQQTIKGYNELVIYTNAVTCELSDLRTVGDESAMGSRHPLPARRSHLKLVK